MHLKEIIAKYKAIFIALAVAVVATATSILALNGKLENKTVVTDNITTETIALYSKICDGKEITKDCTGPDGKKYSIYKQHDEVPEETKEVYHAATPEKSHSVYHEPVYGTRQVRGDCIRTNIKYKSGSCALSQCRDGSYSGSTGRGTCSYHGGVARSGGPWYTYTTEKYIITPGWTEKIVDVPAKAAWTETVVVSPKQEAYLETELAEEA